MSGQAPARVLGASASLADTDTGGADARRSQRGDRLGQQPASGGIVDAAGRRVANFGVVHDVVGLAEFDQRLGVCGEGLPVAIERAEGLLVEHLQAQNLRVYPRSPRIAARIRERYRVAAVKSDAFDAYTVADALRHEQGRWRPLAELRALTRDRERIVTAQVRVKS